jgi:hypothetical protein
MSGVLGQFQGHLTVLETTNTHGKSAQLLAQRKRPLANLSMGAGRCDRPRSLLDI